MTNKKKEILFIVLSIFMYVIVFMAGVMSGYITARHDYLMYTYIQQLEKETSNKSTLPQN